MFRPGPCKCPKKIHVPVIWVLGGSGSGKGTQCEKMVEKYNFKHFSTGELLRAEVASKSEKGKALAHIMAAGKLVANEDVLLLLEMAIRKVENTATGFLIDGYPREKDQGVEFENIIGPVDLILHFTCSDEVSLARILHRADQAETARDDDNEATLKVRIAIFRENINEILAKYPDKTCGIDAERPVDEVFADVVKAVDAIVEKKARRKDKNNKKKNPPSEFI